jgi:hypothetical protein
MIIHSISEMPSPTWLCPARLVAIEMEAGPGSTTDVNLSS